jgi:hypothetical protein
MRCFAGCDIKSIVAALGLRMTDLFDGKELDAWRAGVRPELTPDMLASALRKEVQFVQDDLLARGIDRCF